MSVTKEEIQALVAKASCVNSCIPRGMQTAALISLIQTAAEDTSTPQQLMDKARCIDSCISPGMLMPVLIALGAESSSPSCDFQEGAGSPVGVFTPAFIGQLYHDTVADTYYRSTGLTSADWTAISGGATPGLLTLDPSVDYREIDIGLAWSVTGGIPGTGNGISIFNQAGGGHDWVLYFNLPNGSGGLLNILGPDNAPVTIYTYGMAVWGFFQGADPYALGLPSWAH